MNGPTSRCAGSGAQPAAALRPQPGQDDFSRLRSQAGQQHCSLFFFHTCVHVRSIHWSGSGGLTRLLGFFKPGRQQPSNGFRVALGHHRETLHDWAIFHLLWCRFRRRCGHWPHPPEEQPTEQQCHQGRYSERSVLCQIHIVLPALVFGPFRVQACQRRRGSQFDVRDLDLIPPYLFESHGFLDDFLGLRAG